MGSVLTIIWCRKTQAVVACRFPRQGILDSKRGIS